MVEPTEKVQISTTIPITDKKYIEEHGLKVNYVIKRGLMSIMEDPGYIKRIKQAEETIVKQQGNIAKLQARLQDLTVNLDEFKEKEDAQMQ